MVVLHTEAQAARKLAEFRGSREPWIVAVNMVSEGVDIPRLRVGVYASAAKTPLIFRQIVGRFVRTIPGRPPEASWLYLPAEQTLRGTPRRSTELRHALPSRRARGGFRRAARAARERALPAGRVRTPQRRVRRADDPVRPPAAARPDVERPSSTPPPAPEPPPVAAFERRDDLRQERSRLVAELHRRDGRSHREINAWVNRAVGVERVESASIKQLERSIEALLAELMRGGRRAAAR